MDGAILQIGIAKIHISTCVPHGLHWPLIQIIFSVHCNQTSQIPPPPPKYFPNSPIYHLNSDDSPINMCLEFSSGETIALEMK